jgi:hypothetical protein
VTAAALKAARGKAPHARCPPPFPFPSRFLPRTNMHTQPPPRLRLHPGRLAAQHDVHAARWRRQLAVDGPRKRVHPLRPAGVLAPQVAAALAAEHAGVGGGLHGSGERQPLADCT